MSIAGLEGRGACAYRLHSWSPVLLRRQQTNMRTGRRSSCASRRSGAGLHGLLLPLWERAAAQAGMCGRLPFAADRNLSGGICPVTNQERGQ